ncbi:MAG: cation-translocating P-type ATPase [Gammaproteobacteria bacterium]
MVAVAALGSHAFWTNESGGHARTVFAAEGIRCAACSRSIERAVRTLPGIEAVTVNVATSRICVDWDPTCSPLVRILEAVATAGFKPIPLAGADAEAAFVRERRLALKRIGLAGLGMMQVMMYVFGVYVARPEAMDPAIATYLRYVAMAITTPVLLYSGAPFLIGAWRDLRRRSLGMDVPVALALVLAYCASVFNTVRGHGQTYFDSVTMFIFFLGAGRYVEMVVRQRSLTISEAVARSLPAQVSRVNADGTSVRIPTSNIVAGDILQIPKGGVIPVDSVLLEGTALVDESLVTGESKAERRVAGDQLLGGALSVGNAIRVRARCGVAGSTLASVVARLERAQSVRPAIARAADRAASWFIAASLIVCVVVVALWLMFDPARAFPAALAVLVVTCPCALSLATPVAVAAASTRLARRGLLVTRADALERLARVDAVVLDKTGTLTAGGLSLVRTTLLGSLDRGAALAAAAALERGSSHPVAALFANGALPEVVAVELSETDGLGVAGRIGDRRWRIGRHDFVSELSSDVAAPADDPGIFLGNESGLVAVYQLGEAVRPDAFAAVEQLGRLGVRAVMASGDAQQAVDAASVALRIEHATARLGPAQKVELIRELQAAGNRVLAVGDGVNDGPALAAADVSCAMGQGSAIAQAAADFLLLNDALGVIPDGIRTARRMLRIVRQNLRWSLAYNLTAVPLAALDLVPPWLAALGMSVSSLVVVLNARRLAGEKVVS